MATIDPSYCRRNDFVTRFLSRQFSFPLAFSSSNSSSTYMTVSVRSFDLCFSLFYLLTISLFVWRLFVGRLVHDLVLFLLKLRRSVGPGKERLGALILASGNWLNIVNLKKKKNQLISLMIKLTNYTYCIIWIRSVLSGLFHIFLLFYR